jgi:DNA polymerase III subunit delta
MQAEDFLRTLDSAKIEPVYLFVGGSPSLVEDAWKKLIIKAVPKGARNFNGERVRAKEIPAGQVLERLVTIPMFGAKRLFMVENIEAWAKEDRAVLESFLPRLPSSTCLVMTAAGRKGLEGLAKSVESKGKVIQFRIPSEKEAPRWLIEKAKEKGKILSHRAAFLLVEMVGSNLDYLLSELEKICTFIGDSDRIEAEDIGAAATSQRSFSMFDLFDQVKARQAGKAITSLRSLILSGEPPLKILSSLAWQIRTLWQVKGGLGQGLSEAQLIERLKLHPFAVKKACEQAARFSETDLHTIHDAIRQTDVAIKSTGSPPELILESLLLDLCVETKKPSFRGR